MHEALHGRPARRSRLVIGCNTFPTWNGYPGLFASLATGNPVVVKPHPRRAAAGDHRRGRPRGARRGRLLARPGRAGGRGAGRGLAADLALPARGPDRSTSPARPRSATGWRRNATQAVVYTEKAGVNTRRHRLHRRLPGHARATSRSRCPSTAARCAPRRRTCSSRAAASTPTRATVVRRGGGGPRRPRSTGCSATRSGRPRSWARSSGRRRSRGSPRPSRTATWCCASRGGRAPRVPRRGHAHAAAGRAAAPSTERVYAQRVLRAGLASSSPPAARTRASSCCAPDHARARGADRGRLLDRPRRARAGRGGRASTAACPCRSTSPAGSTSTSRRRSPTSTRPARTRRRARRSPTRRSSRRGST